MLDLALLDAIGDLIAETVVGTHDGHRCVCVEKSDDASCCDLAR